MPSLPDRLPGHGPFRAWVRFPTRWRAQLRRAVPRLVALRREASSVEQVTQGVAA